MFYKNARIFASDCRFHHGAFEVTADGRFGQVLPDEKTRRVGQSVAAASLPELRK